jgi:hypothetical protein
MRRALDVLFEKKVRNAVTHTTSQAAGTAVSMGAQAPNREPFAVLDIAAVSGTTPSLTQEVEGSDDNTSWAAAGSGGATFGAKNATGRSFISLKPFRYYRAAANTISGTTPSFTYSLSIVGHAPIAGVTQT